MDDRRIYQCPIPTYPAELMARWVRKARELGSLGKSIAGKPGELAGAKPGKR